MKKIGKISSALSKCYDKEMAEAIIKNTLLNLRRECANTVKPHFHCSKIDKTCLKSIEDAINSIKIE